MKSNGPKSKKTEEEKEEKEKSPIEIREQQI